jgi:YD repeat-containing protein
MGYGYNANAQLSRIVQLQNGTETARWTLGYNEQGDVQRLTYTDATTGVETTQRIPQYDPHGRPEVIVDPDGNRTRLICNQRGALTRLVQGEQITHFTYDARGVMTRIKTPDGSVFALVYDSDVNLTQVKHNGKAITAAYVATLSAEVKKTVIQMQLALLLSLKEPNIKLEKSNNLNLSQREQGRTKLFFDKAKETLTVDPETPGRLSYTIPASSGRETCIQPDCNQTTPDNGPIPSGSYTINIRDIRFLSLFEALYRAMRGGDWGRWNTPLISSKDTNVYNRNGFYMHGGRFKGSAGCIDIGGGVFGDQTTEKIRQDILNDPDGIVEVIVK